MTHRDPRGVDPSRRRFMTWCAAVGGGLAQAASLVSLSGCGGGGDNRSDASSSGGSAQAPFSDILAVDRPKALSISVQARAVEWVPGQAPSAANAWVYAVDGVTSSASVLPNHLGATIVVRRGTPCTITWTNQIPASGASQKLLADPPINPPAPLEMCGNVVLQSPVGVVTHLHGARVAGSADGWPLTPLGFAGNPYGFPSSHSYTYPNDQRATMLWYHDHSMDRTGVNVHAGLAGLYFIRDAADDAILALVGGATQELPLVIQDRHLTKDQKGIDFLAGVPSGRAVDSANRPEFLGKTLFVNGHLAPHLTLARQAWRLRVLNGSNARTYALALLDPDALAAGSGRLWYTDLLRLIGNEGGLLSYSLAPEATGALVLACAQRRDIVVDLAALPASVQRLRLVNLGLLDLAAEDDRNAEAIFTTEENCVQYPRSVAYSSQDRALYDALGSSIARVADLTLTAAPADARSPAVAALDAVLASAADDDDFRWDGRQLVAASGAPFGPNRLILLMSNTEGLTRNESVNGVDGWGDVQLFELSAGGQDWLLPFDVDLASASNPPLGGPSAAQRGYTVARRSFFADVTAPDIAAANAYPALHAPTITPKAGTYERWYVANIGNAQPLNNLSGDPDMHPLHIHLVNFVVTRRWQLGDGPVGAFTELAPSDLGLDRIARQDTVMIPSGQLVELLVWFPPGYTGDYTYHCHLVEHEDKCMMSHFTVQA
ncbi:MAG TPA: multicopper oxidase domain-containing protein [Burkholderiaceae bacterium]|nr:multicopper oxidase domain-containing protein [Burkholderiaceae bacterium]HMX11162.1 multicopper oxidase domain-containing protein [Burkholderiaceae bacterium]HMY99134.1 multicopper oxidase domain-containing protein [Burkholderiaceae bacterium]HNB45594.1 multicopper oxidase domain-containing protein [Burkholderiaceae bacterium]HNG78994.1 multicopper oxidase domain-containing protein [Burkholderiaceae bacterium]